MGHIYSPTFQQTSGTSLLKLRMGISRYDFSSKKSLMDFVSITAFGKCADRINERITCGDNFICCFCDIKVSKYTTKAGTAVEHVEFIVNEFRTSCHKKSTLDAGDSNGTASGSPSTNCDGSTLPSTPSGASDGDGPTANTKQQHFSQFHELPF
jgi:hypothetical protein